MSNEHATSHPISPHEATSRAVKASKLAHVLVQHGATAADVRALPAPGRRMAEELVRLTVDERFREGSDLTWQLVIALVESRAAHPSAPKSYGDDPFSVLPPVAS